MKRFFQAVCLVSLAFGMVLAVGSFSPASADRDGYRRHHSRAYERAYRHCAREHRVGGHRFERCMDRELGRRR
jgi:hypothetical protein